VVRCRGEILTGRSLYYAECKGGEGSEAHNKEWGACTSSGSTENLSRSRVKGKRGRVSNSYAILEPIGEAGGEVYHFARFWIREPANGAVRRGKSKN